MARLQTLKPRLATLDLRIGVPSTGTIQEGDREAQRHRYSREWRESRPSAKWYRSARWQRLRTWHLRHEPLCRMCQAKGLVTAANVCDHIEPHRDDEAKFWAGPFQSLCKPCHDSVKQREERAS